MLVYPPAYFYIGEGMSVCSCSNQASPHHSFTLSEFYFDFAWYHEDFYEPDAMFGPHWADITLTTKDSVELHCYLIKHAEDAEVKVRFGLPSCLHLTP
jgi:hypothetical protein